ncbi:MAG TPA: ATP-binding protein [Casimicrobiaceae bacterium]|jgi:dedicated sortase system histidine kinase
MSTAGLGEAREAHTGGAVRNALPRVALGIRAQLLLVLTVFAAIPFLGVAYIRELEGVLRAAQERTLAGTAQAVATALHDRPRLFDAAPAWFMQNGAPPRDLVDAAVATRAPGDGAAELAQILEGLTRTRARIRVVDRAQKVIASAGSLQRDSADLPPPGRVERLLHPLYARVLDQPAEDFRDDDAATLPPGREEVASALDGIASTARRAGADPRVTIVSAAYPIWVGDRVRGAVVAEETTNAVLATRNRAFERLFTLVLATLLVGSLAVTAYATWLTSRIRRLRDDADRAIDAHGRLSGPLAGSAARDEIGDLARGISGALARLSDYASYQEQMAGRLSHELRTPLAVVRSSLDNLRQTALETGARVYVERAQGGIDRLAHILTLMSEATRLEQALADTPRERFDLTALVAACIDGYRSVYPARRFECSLAPQRFVDGAPELVAQMLDKLVANAVEFATGDPIGVMLEPWHGGTRLAVSNVGPALPATMQDRLFDSMVSVRARSRDDVPHLGLGLYVVRLCAQFHGASVHADDRADHMGVVVSVVFPGA